LIAGETAIAAVLNMICGLDVTSKISAVDFRDDALLRSVSFC
jgi:hypothetical protein